ncbi:GntR family transcriptional regulator [Sedimentitalea sp. JM2-8]|uniref:GntR family transcriptional regulator n=1 Tax=Sedimentitalea xiamensis TaxID=3050037 RepID=A0ABT7FJ24_9RHOB|nr:GntR family transcriptional regulator [Sedimentitalea xiamensis]MDK3074990.1 GntR family transcriptional regulator [Sedimentitalea xiamensis]
MTSSVTIPRAALHTQVADALRDQIVRGKIASGMRLNEIELCKLMGISRTPLREAIKILEAESLIEIRPHRGASVAEIKTETLNEIFQVLAPLEQLALELAMARMSDEEYKLVQATHDRMMVCYHAQDREGCFLNDIAFHNQIVSFAGNEVLQAIHTNLMNRSQRGRYFAPRFSQVKLDEAMAAHEELISAIMDRNIPSASRIMHDHVVRTGAFVLDSIQSMHADHTRRSGDASEDPND